MISNPARMPRPPKPPKSQNRTNAESDLAFYKWAFFISMGLLMALCILLVCLPSIFTPTVICEVPPPDIAIYQQNIGPVVKHNIQGAHIHFDWWNIAKHAPKYGHFSGNSMQPTIFEGNKVLTMDIPLNYKIKAGDIIRYTTANTSTCEAVSNGIMDIDMPTIHRVTAVYDDLLVVIGDNNYEIEEINRCQVTGLVIGVLYT